MCTCWRHHGVIRIGWPILALGLLWAPAASAEEEGHPVAEPEQPVTEWTLSHDDTRTTLEPQPAGSAADGQREDGGVAPPESGFLTREQIESIIRRHSSGLRYCYERELLEEPYLEGRITVRWNIELDGRVSAATAIENTMGSKAVESCLLSEVGRMRFDRPNGGRVNVTYPFTFTTSP
ncbi:MAG: hypothetical protein EA398_18190 [Deltaproteobacteria bacterium]|nr:MAG: hypothetical protein EA398_18190 [Deltaproteobacteria bacterium]